MIVEPATVVEVRADVALVRCLSQSGCERCAAGKGCGGGVMSRLLGDRLNLVSVATGGKSLRAGDEVLIGLHEQGLVQASAAVYLVPLVAAMLGGVAAASAIGPGDAIVLSGTVVGFVGGLFWARRFGVQREGDDRFAPRIIETAAPEPTRTACRVERP